MVIPVLLTGVLLLFASCVNGYGRGPPACTIHPHHGQAQPQPTPCLDHFVATYTPENSKALKAGRPMRPDEQPDGQLVVIAARQPNTTFKGIVLHCQQKLKMPLLAKNKDLKLLNCPRESGSFVSHKNPAKKTSVSLFFKGDRPVAANETMFAATILESYNKFWQDCAF